MQKFITPQKTLKQRLFIALFAMLMGGFAWAGWEDAANAAHDRKEYTKFLKIVKPAAIKGEARAQHWLADTYRNGEGVVQD